VSKVLNEESRLRGKEMKLSDFSVILFYLRMKEGCVQKIEMERAYDVFWIQYEHPFFPSYYLLTNEGRVCPVIELFQLTSGFQGYI